MNRKLKFCLVSLMFFGNLILINPSHAAISANGQGNCKVIHWEQDAIYTIKAKMHHATHIVLPERMLTDPIPGNKVLWKVEGQGFHVFVKPTTTFKEGKETSLSVVTNSNSNYDFKLVRVKNNADICVRIKKDGHFIQGTALRDYKTPKERNDIALQQKVLRLQSQLLTAKKVAHINEKRYAENALKKYRSNIYTKYTWNGGSSFQGNDLISDVWDDGRFSFIRVRQDNKGLLTVRALVDDEDEILEYKYDRETKVYKIIGIYPELRLRYGESEVEVSRLDSKTSGGY